MLNIDKYRREIEHMIENGAKPSAVISRMCLEKTNSGYVDVATELDWLFSNSVDAATSIDWLFSEYKSPLLKNGDGLKPGDWIMVRVGEGAEWQKRQFLFYYDGLFYCEIEGGKITHGKYTAWPQARLPEEGER